MSFYPYFSVYYYIGVGGMSEATKSAALCSYARSYAGVSGRLCFTVALFTDTVKVSLHSLCAPMTKVTCEKGQLT